MHPLAIVDPGSPVIFNERYGLWLLKNSLGINPKKKDRVRMRQTTFSARLDIFYRRNFP
jgi:hypothetical protein